ncbi:MAG: DUF5685 family protein [Eubacteriales bacterium]
MFGYIKPYVPNLTVGDYEYYRAAYCGLCRSMGNVCGASSRLTLSYDGVFLALLRMALAGETPECEPHRCPYALAKKNMLVSSSTLDYSAGAFGVLAALKLEDDIEDEKGLKKLGARLAHVPAKKWVERADCRDTGIADKTREKLAKYYSAEKENRLLEFSDAGIEASAEAFGEVVGLLAARGIEDENYAIAHSVGRHVGRWIYCVDALDDLSDDAAKGRYNAFIASYGDSLDEGEKLTLRCLLRDESDSAAAMLALADADESSRAYRIVKNILTEGMPTVADAVLDGTYKKPERDEINKLLK